MFLKGRGVVGTVIFGTEILQRGQEGAEPKWESGTMPLEDRYA